MGKHGMPFGFALKLLYQRIIKEENCLSFIFMNAAFS